MDDGSVLLSFGPAVGVRLDLQHGNCTSVRWPLMFQAMSGRLTTAQKALHMSRATTELYVNYIPTQCQRNSSPAFVQTSRLTVVFASAEARDFPRIPASYLYYPNALSRPEPGSTRFQCCTTHISRRAGQLSTQLTCAPSLAHGTCNEHSTTKSGASSSTCMTNEKPGMAKCFNDSKFLLML